MDFNIQINTTTFGQICSDLRTYTIPECYWEDIMLKELVDEVYAGKESVAACKLLEFQPKTADTIVSHLVKRVGIICLILYANENKLTIDNKVIWPLLYQSMLFFLRPVKASIGSQGFLSIPLYRHQSEEELILIRVHIWDVALEPHIDQQFAKDFSIHSHLNHGTSHILCGTVFNTRYQINQVDEDVEKSIYEIEWSQSKSTDNQMRSELVNTSKRVDAVVISHEAYSCNQRYEMMAGEFHASSFDRNEEIAVTLFTFNSNQSRIKKSKVIGPAHLQTAPSINYPEVELSDVLNSIDTKISANG